MFGVRYEPRLFSPGRPPADFIEQCREYGKAVEKRVDGESLEIYRWGAASGYVAPAYIARIDDAVGYGLYADRDVMPGEMLGEYAGRLSRDWVAEATRPSDFNPYLLKYPFDCRYAIDAGERGNEMRFVNHSSKRKNIKRTYLFIGGMLRVIFAADKAIARHSQFLLDYGKNYWRSQSPRDLI